MEPENNISMYDGDIYFYYGKISRNGYHLISSLFEAKIKKSKTACIVLVTYGGDPDAAYRIARAARHHYENIEILIPDICKSAGTLLCIGANKLIFGDRGELGPLDIQLSKPDEMFENMSGLDIIQAISALEGQLLASFRRYLLDIRGGSNISTKIAADIATKLAQGLVGPMAQKIDAVTLGEHQRAMQIALDYGQRLNEMVNSLKKDSLVELISGYPSHGFVIDRKEASKLFNLVEAPDGSTYEVYSWARRILEEKVTSTDPLVCDVKDIIFNGNSHDSSRQKNEKTDAVVKNIKGSNKDDDGKPEQKSKRNESVGSK